MTDYQATLCHIIGTAITIAGIIAMVRSPKRRGVNNAASMARGFGIEMRAEAGALIFICGLALLTLPFWLPIIQAKLQ